MDNFKAVYKILSSLEKAMDLPNFDIEQIRKTGDGSMSSLAFSKTENRPLSYLCQDRTKEMLL